MLAIFSAIAWGTNGTFCAILSSLGLTTMNIAILAPAFNFGFFFLWLLFSPQDGFKVNRKMLLILLADGALAGFVNYAFVKSVTYFPVGIVSTLVYCNVFTIMIMSRIFFHNKITRRKVVAGLVSLFGVALVVDAFSQGFSLNYFGLLWILGTILSWSGMITFERYLLSEGVSGPAILMYTGLFAVLTLAIASPPLDLLGNILQISSQTGGMALLLLVGYGMIPQVGSYFLYITGLKHIEPSYIQVAFFPGSGDRQHPRIFRLRPNPEDDADPGHHPDHRNRRLHPIQRKPGRRSRKYAVGRNCCRGGQYLR